MRPHTRNQCNLGQQRRGMALYITVFSTALVVSMLGVTGMLIVRIDHENANRIAERREARALARSAVEVALVRMDLDPSWRTNHTNGVESALVTVDVNKSATISWVLEDTDGSLTDADTNLTLKGVGRIGTTVQVSSVSLISSSTGQVGPAELRSMTDTSQQRTATLRSDRFWGQYLKPTLPANATGWWITGIELQSRRRGNNKTVHIRLYDPLITNFPSVTQLDSMTFNSNTIPDSWQWNTFNFGGNYTIDPNDGVCICLETASSGRALQMRYKRRNVNEPDAGLLEGNPTWHTLDPAKALQYRVHGIYTVPGAPGAGSAGGSGGGGGVNVVGGTWTWDSAP